MLITTPDQNKAVVLEAFDLHFNKRDYAATDHMRTFVQHALRRNPTRQKIAPFEAVGCCKL